MQENQKNNNIWDLLKEDFDETLPRRQAIALKPTDSTILFAYPSHQGTLGWCFDDREATGYDEDPSYEIFLAPWTSPGLTMPLSKSSFVWTARKTLPDLVERRISYSDVGLRIKETMCRAIEGAFTWRLQVENFSLRPAEKSLFVVLKSPQRFKNLTKSGNLFSAENIHLYLDVVSWGCYDYLEEAEEEINRVGLQNESKGDRYLVIEIRLSIPPKDCQTVSMGLSFDKPEPCQKAKEIQDLVNPIRNRWNEWFNRLPKPHFDNEDEEKAYYKCWWVIRFNYYKSPRFGHLVCEALPVYRGYWLWGLDSSEWHSDQDVDYTSVNIKQALDLFFKYQREDGYITHAIYLDEENPGEHWSQSNLTQTPHIPWVCLRYAESTGDFESLKEWYPKLIHFYEYLCKSRDEKFRNLHLWAILSSFDTGLDTTSAFQKVTYGVNGQKENYCYPSIYAAERCRYEQALCQMARILGKEESEKWLMESHKTQEAMNQILWDPKRNWYGVLHEDGTLDTRVGVDGLFPLAYGIVDSNRAELTRENFEKLIGVYGIHTVAPGEFEQEMNFYWRGAAWPKSCAMGIVSARNYFPDFLEKTVQSTVRMLLRWPSIWECLNARTGDVGRGDMGLRATPWISSNVGAGEAMGAIMTSKGIDMMSFDGILSLAPVTNIHWGGFRLDLEQKGSGWHLAVREAEKKTGDLSFRKADDSVVSIKVEAGKDYYL